MKITVEQTTLHDVRSFFLLTAVYFHQLETKQLEVQVYHLF